ncbi:hypothetical protein BLA6863_00195 [Burkholderia lata]|uniref:Uncharacterized protein n=1 Tax=Burkholderia lata (strain ATCC 17760 / DSM 23089 / LMG 22485 / NCIMB 9086 / R18194 / 383) TaxID=482957 RepID=A0A6P2GXA5_BURL3|nr:hypothetical protein BLA6863_00195 [Burkholderia lata]
MLWKLVIVLLIAFGLFGWAVYRGVKQWNDDEHHRH